MNKILAGHKFVANFLDEPVRIGMIYQMDDEQFIPVLHFNDIYPDVDLSKLTDSGSKAPIKFSETSSVAMTFGATATTGIGKSEVKFSFKRSKSVAGALADTVIDTLRHGTIKEQLKKIWIDNGFDKFNDKYIFVFGVATAASGTIIYSEEKNNEVVLKHKLGNSVSTIADLGSGQFEYVSNSKRTLEIIRPMAHKPLFKAFTFRSNWQPEILG